MSSIRVSSIPGMILVGSITFIALLRGVDFTTKTFLLVLAVALFSGILSSLTILPVAGQLVYVYGMKWVLGLAGFSLTGKFLLGESLVVPVFVAFEYVALYFIALLIDGG